MAIIELLNNPWIIALTFFYVGHWSCKSTYDRLIQRYKEEIKELNVTVDDCEEEIQTLNVKYGIEEIDWEQNLFLDDDNKLPN